MNLVLWALFGALVGALLHLLAPGRLPRSLSGSAALGALGGLVGGYLGGGVRLRPITSAILGITLSIFGALLALVLYHSLRRPRAV